MWIQIRTRTPTRYPKYPNCASFPVPPSRPQPSSVRPNLAPFPLGRWLLSSIPEQSGILTSEGREALGSRLLKLRMSSMSNLSDLSDLVNSEYSVRA